MASFLWAFVAVALRPPVNLLPCCTADLILGSVPVQEAYFCLCRKTCAFRSSTDS